MNFFKKTDSQTLNFLGSLASLVGLIGIPISFWMYFSSIRSPELSYYVHPIRTSIVKSLDTKGLQVSFEGKEIKGDISTVQVSLWNKGKQPIKTAEILTPIQFITEKNTTILSASISKTGRDVSDIKLDESQFENGIVGVSWRILEQGDGCVLQIVYVGDTNKPINIKGDIEGQKEIKKTENNKIIINRDKRIAQELLAMLVFMLFLVVVQLVWVRFLIKHKYSNIEVKHKRAFNKKLRFILMVGVLTALIMAFRVLYEGLSGTAPFGF